MALGAPTLEHELEMRPVYGLTQGLPKADLESLTVDAIRTHRRLVDAADQLFQALPDAYKSSKATGGPQHLGYIQACMEMHAQMYVVNTLVTILGYIPKVSVN
ncbi:transcriptional regulator [Agrobacterium tumefaciens]|uniref:transcriptional repressor TraM n=1 Tax=Agrobacterium tumefaciens TaxID=358 RepID=UPI001572D1E1|nr:transcriptional repressor TraM [Agrobacterium tumefaciens]NSY99635.1 transcriptional regulator [Agrobacterium tumefaciens]NSZ36388.1 transcriptional regulator [Agrobacterium tumefaciens]NTB21904.1 transcriptional regulator [Agrobacterium tumefaciens]NTB31750.1 transcriptional regulator [Agrobacterium tumefaciens]NTB32231.1 transcriptional regulator [Agrobacterium tumefaciens]